MYIKKLGDYLSKEVQFDKWTRFRVQTFDRAVALEVEESYLIRF